jgi:hypothetical protein
MDARAVSTGRSFTLRTLVVGIAAGAVVAAAAITFTRRGAPPPSPGVETPSPTAATAALEAQIGRLQQQVGALQRQLVAGGAAAAADAREVRDLAGAVRGKEAREAAEAAERALPREQAAEIAANRMYEKLDRQLAASGPDPAWQPEAEARAALGRLDGARVDGVRCARALCRVDVSLKSGVDGRALTDAIAAQPPFSEGVVYRYDAQAPGRVSLYVRRPGMPFEGGDAEGG